MTIGRRMTKNPVVARVGMTCSETLNLMRCENVQKVPVLDHDGNLVGVLTEKDILKASIPSSGMSLLEMAYEVGNMPVEQVMTTDVVSIGPKTNMEEVARIMTTQDLSFLPVVKDRKLVGIVSRSDMFKILMELFGARHYGTRISFVVADKIGTLARISKVLEENGISIISFCTFSDADPGNVICTLKVEGADEDKLVELLGPIVAGFVDLGDS